MTTRNSHSQKTRVIRDNIHGYIALTNVENAFLEQTEFHRLQFVGQNGLTFHTYPSMKHSRFLHSLGSMHLAGSMLLSGMRSGSPAVKSFRDALKAYLEKYQSTLEGLVKPVIKRDRLYTELGIEGDWVLCVMFQAVRIAALIHDIGHPPFSHTVEEALSFAASIPGEVSDAVHEVQKTSSAEGLHEQIGEYLLRKVMLRKLTRSLRTIGSPFVAIATDISVNYYRDPVLEALKGIVDGQFDCDRADYVLRDCAAAGVDFGGYDLPRILPSITVVECSSKWYFRPSLHSLSAIESFYEERLKLYRWIIFHHSCVRSHIALQRATISLIRLYEGQGGFSRAEIHELHDAVAPIRRLWQFRKYSDCDDNWYFAFLAQFLAEVSKSMRKMRAQQQVPSSALRELYGLVQQARWRKGNMLTLWKRVEEYSIFCKELYDRVTAISSESRRSLDIEGSDIPAVNRWLHERLDKHLKVNGLAITEWIESELADKLGGRFLINLVRWIPVGIERRLKRVENAKPGVLLVDRADNGCVGLIPLGMISPVPGAVNTIWDNTVHFRAYMLHLKGDKPVQPTSREFAYALAEILMSNELDRFTQAPAASAAHS